VAFCIEALNNIHESRKHGGVNFFVNVNLQFVGELSGRSSVASDSNRCLEYFSKFISPQSEGSDITVELTRRREFIQASPDES